MRPLFAALVVMAVLVDSAVARPRTHNVILFVADGLRPGIVNDTTAPAIASLMERGVRFANSHAIFPTFTTANASSMATGHLLGDTGDFSNTVYSGFPVPGAGDSLTPFLESDPVLGDIDEHFSGDYLNEETILRAARDAGFSTATIGKVGPALIFDHTERTGQKTFVVDDMTGRPGGIPLSDELRQRMSAEELSLQAPTRGANGAAGNNTTPGTTAANVEQQNSFADVATQAVLPIFKARNKPFALVFWSRDPDVTQHNQGDSLGRLMPGINGPTSLAAVKNADADLAKLLDALKRLGLDRDTDLIVTSDHGFSTISKESASSWAASQNYKDVTAHLLPPGFVALDLAHSLEMNLYDPDAKGAAVAAGTYPSHGNGLIGDDAAHPKIVVASNGGSDLVFLPTGDKALAARVVTALSAQDYVSGLFVDDSLGRIPGTLPLSAIGLKGWAVTPMPAIAVKFRTFSLGCTDPTTCGVEVADTGLHQGQGMHGRLLAPRHPQHHGRSGPELPAAFRGSRTGKQRRYRQDGRGNPRFAHSGQGQAGRACAVRSDAERGHAACRSAHPQIGAGRSRPCHRAAKQGGGRDALLRRRGLSRSHAWAAGRSAAVTAVSRLFGSHP